MTKSEIFKFCGVIIKLDPTFEEIKDYANHFRAYFFKTYKQDLTFAELEDFCNLRMTKNNITQKDSKIESIEEFLKETDSIFNNEEAIEILRTKPNKRKDSKAYKAAIKRNRGKISAKNLNLL